MSSDANAMSSSTAGVRFNRIKNTIEHIFNPVYYELENESHLHSVPLNSETHFKLLLVSECFQNLSRVQRQQLVYSKLSLEFSQGLHAFSQRLYTPQEWIELKDQVKFQSPQCASKGIEKK